MNVRADETYSGPIEPPRGPRTRSRAQKERASVPSGDAFGVGIGRSVVDTIRQLPNYGRLLAGLLTDRRVSALDKALVGAAVAYVIAPIDIIPDFVPVIGELDELFVLVMALQHLVTNADPQIVIEHWSGNLDELEDLNVRRALMAAAFFLPRRLRRRLRVIGRFD